MPSGMLVVDGSLDVSQFWPAGRSDADTTKVIVKVVANAIKFRKDSSSPFRSTHVFDKAVVVGRTRKPPIKNGQLTIRLQGIDATELHYQPSPLSPAEKKGLSAAKLNAYHLLVHSYRQLLAATATKALHDFLAASGKATLACHVFTQVDHPDEVFDTYGRLVGDIEVKLKGKTVNLNQWLAQQGWAFPTFYSSMTNDEINTFIALAKTARSKKAPVWKYLAMTIGPFNFQLREPKKGDTSVLATDKGPVILPKLYRRYTNWSVRRKAKVTSGNFQTFLAAGSGGRPDGCFETADFLANGVYSATPRTIDQFVVGGKTIKFQPDGLVFQEAPSKLVGANGKPISNF
jgi:endonuclease YncB( thermonuclease family)